MDLSQIYKIFGLNGEYIGYTVLKNGNINKTYKADFKENGKVKSYIIKSSSNYSKYDSPKHHIK